MLGIKSSTDLRLKEQYKDNICTLFGRKLLYMAFYYTKQLREEVGENLAKARKKKGMNQVEVAVEAGLNPSYYGKIERGLVNPSIEKLYKIIKSLGVKSSDIFPF